MSLYKSFYSTDFSKLVNGLINHPYKSAPGYFWHLLFFYQHLICPTSVIYFTKIYIIHFCSVWVQITVIFHLEYCNNFLTSLISNYLVTFHFIFHKAATVIILKHKLLCYSCLPLSNGFHIHLKIVLYIHSKHFMFLPLPGSPNSSHDMSSPYWLFHPEGSLRDLNMLCALPSSAISFTWKSLSLQFSCNWHLLIC